MDNSIHDAYDSQSRYLIQARANLSPRKRTQVPFIKERINVHWNDNDGDRWELGTVRELVSGGTYLVEYDFLLDSSDPNVIEILVGINKAEWQRRPENIQ